VVRAAGGFFVRALLQVGDSNSLRLRAAPRNSFTRCQTATWKISRCAIRMQFLPRLQEGLLRQIIRQVRIPARHAREERPHGRLMPPHQLGEGIPIFARQDADDEVCVGEGHEVGYWIARLSN